MLDSNSETYRLECKARYDEAKRLQSLSLAARRAHLAAMEPESRALMQNELMRQHVSKVAGW